ncbi:DUF5820 family protein [Halomicrococcus sp. SG-WS-1]|uniref:DUF5820 family protein n=1 Tax=Halomicrococcus sp. SG-WS-1 TaxID=3439057 RepID=UPI003F78CA6E
MSLSDLPESWTVWNDEHEGRCVLAYRPDVFDAQAFPAPCMPTISLTPGSPNRPPGERSGEAWYVTFYLEPEVSLPGTRRFDSREAAVDGAVDLAAEFAAGEIDYRDAYQVPREEYLDRLDELTGRDAEH